MVLLRLPHPCLLPPCLVIAGCQPSSLPAWLPACSPALAFASLRVHRWAAAASALRLPAQQPSAAQPSHSSACSRGSALVYSTLQDAVLYSDPALHSCEQLRASSPTFTFSWSASAHVFLIPILIRIHSCCTENFSIPCTVFVNLLQAHSKALARSDGVHLPHFLNLVLFQRLLH